MSFTQSHFKYLLLGGGLFNGLLALELQRQGENNFCIIESQPILGGHHTWSFFKNDIPTHLYQRLQPSFRKIWSQYEVQFPGYYRQVQQTYQSIVSNDFAQLLNNSLKPEQLRLNVAVHKVEEAINGTITVHLESGEKLSCDMVFDSRARDLIDYGPAAFQNFYGLDIKTKNPHRINHPVLMDARVIQNNAYRFFYLLPWSKNELLIEDTRFEMGTFKNVDEWNREVINYIKTLRIGEYTIQRTEVGSLALPLSNQIFSKGKNQKILDVGVRGGFFHPTTGYSLPIAANMVDYLLHSLTDVTEIGQRYEVYKKNWQKQCAFFYKLNRMLYGAAVGDERRNIFKKFYKGNEDTIHRFYSGRLTTLDKVSILTGRPPVSLAKAMKSLSSDEWMQNWTV